MPAEQTWEQWASSNLARGCDENEIRSILLRYGFAASDAKSLLAKSGRTLENPAQGSDNDVVDEPEMEEMACPIQLHNAVAIENDKIELYAVEHFLTDTECAQITALIRENNRRSTTTEDGVSEYRTSRTCDLAELCHPLIDDIDRRICQYMGINPGETEQIQGQLYEPGQEFKAHTDYFEKTSDSACAHIGEQGQRSWTFMVYLNTTREGGATEFPNIDLSIKPTAGTALIWNNRLPDGSCNPDTLHCGSPVLAGFKAVLTKWFRSPNAGHVFNREDNERLPALTHNGFLLTDVPKYTYQALLDFYRSNRSQSSEEHIPQFIQSESSGPPSELIELPDVLKAQVHADLQFSMENWIGDYLEPTYVYGIRKYKRSAVLKMHRDRLQTHVASAIINIDQRVDREWPLMIEDHFYRQHELCLKPGQMLFYEGAKLRHGRPTAFQGECYANVFVHYKLR